MSIVSLLRCLVCLDSLAPSVDQVFSIGHSCKTSGDQVFIIGHSCKRS